MWCGVWRGVWRGVECSVERGVECGVWCGVWGVVWSGAERSSTLIGISQTSNNIQHKSPSNPLSLTVFLLARNSSRKSTHKSGKKDKDDCLDWVLM